MTDEEYDRALIARDPMMAPPSRLGVSASSLPRGAGAEYSYTGPESYGNFLRSLTTGATMNWSDEAEALARSRMAGGRSYEEELRDIRNQYAAFAERNPFTSAAGEFAGGVLPLAATYMLTPATGGAALPAAAAATARSAGALARLKDVGAAALKSAGIGAGQGAVSFAGGAGPEEDRLTAAETGALVGGGLGAAIPIAFPAATAGYRWLRSKLGSGQSAEDIAAERLTRAAADARMSPAQIGQEVAEGRAASIANVDPRFGALAEEVAGASSAAQREAEGLLAPRLATSLERTRAQVGQDLRAGDYAPEMAALKESRAAAANLSYRRAYDAGDVVDDKIQEQLRNPTIIEAWKDAAEIARSNANAARSNAVDAGEKFDPTQFLLRAPGDVPDVRTIDYLKRALDANITAILKKAEPTALESTRLNDLITVRNNLRDRAKDIMPDYRNALDRFSTSRDIEEAFLLGRKRFNTMDPEEIRKMFRAGGGLSEPERYAFRTGVARDIYDSMLNAPAGGNVAERIIRSVGDEVRLRPLFESDAKFDLFKAAINRESQMVNQAKSILAAGEAGGRGRVTSQPELQQQLVQAGAQAVTGSPQTSLISLAARVAQSPGMTDDTAVKMTRMLLSNKPEEVAAAVRLIEDYSARAARSEARQAAAQRFGRRGTIAAAPFAPMPEEEVQTIR